MIRSKFKKYDETKNFLVKKKNKRPWADFVSNISPIIMTNMVTNTNTHPLHFQLMCLLYSIFILEKMSRFFQRSCGKAFNITDSCNQVLLEFVKNPK